VEEKRRSDVNLPVPLVVDMEKMEGVPVPLRRTADGALVADWGQVPARVYVAGLSGDGRRTMTACLQAIATWASAGTADIDTLPWAQLRYAHTTAIRAARPEPSTTAATPPPPPTNTSPPSVAR